MEVCYWIRIENKFNRSHEDTKYLKNWKRQRSICIKLERIPSAEDRGSRDLLVLIELPTALWGSKVSSLKNV